MNKERRKELAAIGKELENLELLIEGLRDRLETVRDDEQGALENMPESLQEGETGARMSEIVDELDSAISDLESIEFEDIKLLLAEAAE